MTTHSDGILVGLNTPHEEANGNALVKSLPADFYAEFLSNVARERKPSPSMFLMIIYELSRLNRQWHHLSSWAVPIGKQAWRNITPRWKAKRCHVSVQIILLHDSLSYGHITGSINLAFWKGSLRWPAIRRHCRFFPSHRLVHGVARTLS